MNHPLPNGINGVNLQLSTPTARIQCSIMRFKITHLCSRREKKRYDMKHFRIQSTVNAPQSMAGG